MWPFTPKTLYDRYSKLMKLIMSIDSHFEIIENKKDSVRLHLPNYKGNQPMDFHIYLLEPFLYISFVTEVEGEKITVLNNYHESVDQQDMFNMAMSSNLERVHQVLENKLKKEEKTEEKQTIETNSSYNSGQEQQENGIPVEFAIEDLKETFDYNESFKKHALTFLILRPKSEFWYYSEQDDEKPLWIYNDKEEKNDLFLMEDRYVTGTFPFLWYLKKYENKEELCWFFDFLNRHNMDLWTQEYAESTVNPGHPEELIKDMKRYVPSLNIRNNPQNIKVNLGWSWIDIQSMIRFIDYCMNNTDWADKPNDRVKTLQDCSTLCDLAYLVMKDMGYDNKYSNQKEKDNEPTIIESWSLLDFAKENGSMKVTAPMTHVNTKTGKEFLKRKCAFTHPTKKDDQGRQLVTFVDFSSNLGELSPKEISAQQNDLIVVKYESGWYVLERKQDNRATNEINRNAIEDILNTAITDYEKANAWTDEYGIQYSSDGRKLLMVPKDIVNYSIKKGTKAICNMAFRNCKELKSITIPDGLTLIGYSAFEGCSNLETIDIPNSVLSIGVNAFWGCIRLYSVNISNQIKSIRNATFVDCKSIMSIKIPDSVKSIGIAAFSNCENLMFVDIPTNVNYIGQQAFHNCRRLSSISIPYSVTVIESGIFSGCSSLKSIDIKNGITNIRDGAFYYCPQLNSIIITMGTIEKIRKQLPEHLHDKIIEKDRRNEKATEVQALDEVVTSWMYQGFIKGYKRVKTGSAYCPFTGNEENVLVFEEGNGGNTIVYNLSGLSVEQINEKKEMLSIEFRQSGYYFLNNSDVADVIESRSTLLYTEEWDGNTIPNIEKEDSPDNTADYNFADSWSILDFAKNHGKMRVEQRKDNETGEEFTSLSFTDSIGRVINVHSFNLEDISLYQILRKIDYYRIGAAPLQYYYPSYYYLYNKTLSFWLPGMNI